MKRIASFVLGAACGLSLPAAAALPGRAPDHYHARTWSIEQGLPQVSVLAVRQGPHGFIWAATQNGLARFDGSHFKVFYTADNPGLSGDYITSLAFDARGRLWIGTPKGVSWFADGRFHGLPAAGAGIHAIVSDGAHIWIGSDGGLREIESADASLTPRVLLADPVYSLLLRADGTLAVGGKGYIWNLGKGKTAGNFALPQPAAVVNTLAEHSGTLWIGTGGGLYRLSHGQVVRTTLAPLAHLYVRALFNRDGRLWIGADHGLFRLTGTTQVDDFRAAAGLEDIWVRSFGNDREGDMWIGTMGAGLVRLRGNDIAYLGHDAGLGNPIAWALCQDPDGDVWIGTENGVYRYAQSDRRIHLQFGARQLPAPMVSSLLRDGKRLWIGTLRGLALAVDGRITKLPNGLATLPPVQIYALATDGGGLWIGTAEGLYRYAGGQLRAYTAADGLTTSRVRVIHKTGGGLWIGTERGLFAGHDGRFKPLGTQAGLGSESIQSISGDGDSIWIGTRDGGLFRYRNGHFTHYTQTDGLPAQLIVNAIGDGHGDLWLSNYRGIYELKIADLDALDAGKLKQLPLRTFAMIDGESHIQCNGGANQTALLDAAGNFWCGMINGIVAINTRHPALNRVAPLAAIEDVTRGKHRYDALSQAALTLAPGAGDLEFRYAGLSFAAPDNVTFQYRLLGYDDGWIDAGTRREAFYTNLPPGRYVFEMKAANGDGAWSGTAGIPLTLQPFFYQTWWFFAVCVLLAASLLYGLYRLRMHQAYANRAMLERIVTSRTAELQDANRRLATASLTDTLTGLKNRRHLLEQIDKDLAQTRRAYKGAQVYANKDIVFFMLDIDGFAKINAAHGREAADLVLIQYARAIAAEVRDSDYIVRWGGDEFVVVARQTENTKAPVLAERLRRTLGAQSLRLRNGSTVTATCSIGYCGFPLAPDHLDRPSWEETVTLAGIALERAKAGGGNAWAGFKATAKTDPEVVVLKARADLSWLLKRGQIEIESSHRTASTADS